ncbi:hypothetical protein, partial [Listeria monocytogenes]|uniref:hypothetical protein n=1 Tax=Listeria monocytogenes TaxID=1639 RepID=UPI002FDC1436
ILWDGNRAPTANHVQYKSGATGANYDVLYPFDIYCVADSVKFTYTTLGGASLSGNLYAFLQVQSSEIKI